MWGTSQSGCCLAYPLHTCYVGREVFNPVWSELSMQNASSEPNETPIIVQGTSAPVFRSNEASESDLRCRRCSGLLIAGYFPASFIDIRIECFQCKEITETPGLSEGEILPHPV